MEPEKKYPPSIRMVALAYAKSEADALAMLLEWRAEPMTYEAISERLAAHVPPVELSPQRAAELILEGQGDQRPPRKERPWRKKEDVAS